MKKLITVVLVILFSVPLISQEVEKKEEKKDGRDTTVITTKRKKIIIVSTKSTTDSVGGDSIIIKKKTHQRTNHYAGIDLGINGWLSPANSFDLQKEAQFLDLNYAKSISVGLNPFEWYIPVAKEKFGLVTGLGFTFNSYDLARDYTIISTDDTIYGIRDTTKSIEKNRIKSTYLQVPLMLETNLGRDADHSFHLAAGLLGGLRLGSKTKQIYDQGGEEFKIKNKDDLSLYPFTLSAMVRIGYGDFTLYATYSLTKLFENDNGPELYPFTVGVSLVSF
jgi:hypothetical protein